MSQWDKLICKLRNQPREMRFAELRKILEYYGYQMRETGCGSSHCTFRKEGRTPITIPRHTPIKKVYIEIHRNCKSDCGRGGKAMKTLEEYLLLSYRMEVIRDTDENGYVVSFPELKGCLTCGDTIEEAVRNAEDAKKEWIAACLEEGREIPEPDSGREYSGQFKLRIPKSLHKTLAIHARQEGISMNQYCAHILSRYA